MPVSASVTKSHRSRGQLRQAVTVENLDKAAMRRHKPATGERRNLTRNRLTGGANLYGDLPVRYPRLAPRARDPQDRLRHTLLKASERKRLDHMLEFCKAMSHSSKYLLAERIVRRHAMAEDIRWYEFAGYLSLDNALGQIAPSFDEAGKSLQADLSRPNTIKHDLASVSGHQRHADAASGNGHIARTLIARPEKNCADRLVEWNCSHAANAASRASSPSRTPGQSSRITLNHAVSRSLPSGRTMWDR